MRCEYCNDEILPVERVTELGKTTCTTKNCVARWLRDEKLKDVRLILVPKQGMAFVKADSAALTTGKSSGRT